MARRYKYYLTWNSYGLFHDVEFRGYRGDIYSLYNQIRWYGDDFSADVNTVGRLSSGGSVEGTIERTEDRDWFQVTLEEGQLYTFDLRGTASGGGTLGDPYLALHDADGNFVMEDYDGSGTSDARLVFYSESPGTYYISANGSGYTTGTYELELTAQVYVDDFAGNTGTTGAISAGEIRAGEIGYSLDQDWFQVTFEAGQIYTFDLRGAAGGGGTLGDPRLFLYDVDGNFVAEDYDGSGTSDARLMFYAETAGTYFISADGTGYTSGTYELELGARPYVDDFAGDASTTGVIAAGETITGEIGAGGDRDWIRVDLTEGEAYAFDLRGSASGSGTLPDPVLELYDAGGNFVDGNDDWKDLDSHLVHTASATGTYYLSAQAYADAYTGTYALSVASGGQLLVAASDDLL